MIVVLLIGLFGVHPFHVCVTDIEYREADKVIQVTQRIFLDDLELAIRNHSDKKTWSIDNEKPEVTTALLRDYLKKHVALYLDGKQVEMVFLGNEMESDVMWCYFEMERVKKFDKLSFRNSVLLSEYADQENIVHFKNNGAVKSERIHRGKEAVTFN